MELKPRLKIGQRCLAPVSGQDKIIVTVVDVVPIARSGRTTVYNYKVLDELGMKWFLREDRAEPMVSAALANRVRR